MPSRFLFALQGLRTGLWGVLILGLGIAVASVWSRSELLSRQAQTDRPLEGLQLLGVVPDFSLIERSGRRVGPGDLRGKVWVATFFFSRCQATCPLQTARMAHLQADLAGEPDFRLVSITVDPDHDTPPVLGRYAARYRADPDRWFFLTGEKAIIFSLATEAFHLGVGATAAPAMGAPIGARAPNIPHSSRLVLVDRRARIRGYYPSDDAEALTRLRRDILTLLREAT